MPNKSFIAPLAAALLLTAALPIAAHAADVDLGKLQALGQSIARNENRVTPAALNDMIVKDQHNFTLIDVRLADDYQAGHIKGAVNVPLAKLFSADELQRLKRASNVVVYANTGDDGAQAAVLLRLAGVRAASLAGGFDGWAEYTLHPKDAATGEPMSAEQRAAVIRALNYCPTMPAATIPPLRPASTAPAQAPAVVQPPSGGPPEGKGPEGKGPAGQGGPAKPNVPIILQGACG
jgi:rhodanese-related sulfurtransferase